jgi:hypothetical protein
MQRLALVLAVGAVIAACRPDPGQYAAIGLGIAAIGTGWIAYARHALPGLARVAGAGAIGLGAIGLVLGAARVVLALAALGHLDGLIAP